MENITIKINGREVSAPQGSTILEAARLAQIEIPTLCYLKEINEIGACRMCVVEVKGARTLVTACVYPINEGMEVWTNTPKVIESRRKTLQLLLSNHDRKCLSCVRSGNCELQTLCREYKVDDEAYYDGERNVYELDTSAAHMVRDNNKCILCRRCSAVCEKVQGVGVIGANERELHLRNRVDKQLVAAHVFLPAMLCAAALHLVDSHATNIGSKQSVFKNLKLLGTNDRRNLLHSEFLSSKKEMNCPSHGTRFPGATDQPCRSDKCN